MSAATTDLYQPSCNQRLLPGRTTADAFIAIPSARQPQFFSNPDVHQAGRRKSAKQSQAARADTGRVSELRARRAGSLEHDVGHDAWIIGSGHHLGERLTQGSANLAILLELGVGLKKVRVELRLRVRGFDDGDPYAPR